MKDGYKNTDAGRLIRNARLRAHLTENRLADRIGVSVAVYGDLESYEAELFTTLSLRQVVSLCRHLGLSPRFTVAANAPAGTAITAAEVATALEARILERRRSVEAVEEEAGWAVAPVLENPESLWDAWNVDALIDVAEWAGIDWRMVLPG